MALKGNLVIGQSGGPTAVINQSLVGAVLEAMNYDDIENIYGMRNGVQGFLKEDIVNLSKELKEDLEKVANTPSAALGSCRYKTNDEDCANIFKICKKNNIRYFFYIGGNDTAETAHIINTIAQKEDYELHTFHIPKTVDNDLKGNDHTPGYGSAARYVSMFFMGDNLDNMSIPGIKINIVMGRHAGFLTAASVLGKKDESDGPHLIYVPEKFVSLDKIVEDIGNVYEKYGRAVVAVSEGIQNKDGEPIIAPYIREQDAHGNIQLSGSGALGDFLSGEVKKRLNEKLNKKLRVRADTLGYAQRHYPTIVSKNDASEAREVGKLAVQYAMKGEISGSVTINRKEGKEYDIEFGITDLKNVARVSREMPDEFISPDGNYVTDAFIKYARPIVGELPETGKLNNFPVE